MDGFSRLDVLAKGEIPGVSTGLRRPGCGVECWSGDLKRQKLIIVFKKNLSMKWSMERLHKCLLELPNISCM
jgi:hypothetical protein